MSIIRVIKFGRVNYIIKCRLSSSILIWTDITNKILNNSTWWNWGIIWHSQLHVYILSNHLRLFLAVTTAIIWQWIIWDSSILALQLIIWLLLILLLSCSSSRSHILFMIVCYLLWAAFLSILDFIGGLCFLE